MSVGKGLVWAAIIFVFGPIVAGIVIVGAILTFNQFAEQSKPSKPVKVQKAPTRKQS